MKTIYPSKTFLTDARKAFNDHDELEISVSGGWRGKLLSKEVQCWRPGLNVELRKLGVRQGPSNYCGLFMMSLHAVHYMALSARYELRAEVDGINVTLRYQPPMQGNNQAAGTR